MADKKAAKGKDPKQPAGARDRAAVEAALGNAGEPATTRSPLPVAEQEPVSPEEAAAAARTVQGIFKGVAQLVGPEWELPDWYLPIIGEDAALTQREFLPKETTKPYVRLAVKLSGHGAQAVGKTIQRAHAKRAADAAAAGGDGRPAGAGTGGAPAVPAGLRRRAEGDGARSGRPGQNQSDTLTIGTELPSSNS